MEETTEAKKKLQQLGDDVQKAAVHLRSQVENTGPNLLLFSLISLGATIGLQVFLHLLILWIPASLILWVILNMLPLISTFNPFALKKQKDTFIKLGKQYEELTDRRRELGWDLSLIRAAPFAYAGAGVYVISVLIMLLIRSAYLEVPSTFSIWLPFAASLSAIVLIAGGPTIARRYIRASDMTKLLKWVPQYMKGEIPDIEGRRIVLLLLLILLVGVAWIMTSAVLPIWSLAVSHSLYITEYHWFMLLLVLILQVVFIALLANYTTYVSVRTALFNNMSNLSNIDYRVRQLLSTSDISEAEFRTLQNLYYEATKYRVNQQLILGLFPVYGLVYNESYMHVENDQAPTLET